MAVPAPASLRDLYITPSNTWSFVPPSLSHDSSNSTHPPVSGPSTSSQWSTRTAPNPLFDLSSTLSGDDSGLDITSLAKEFLAAALLQYATSALVQPWEVGRTLLQVQWVPRDPSDIAPDTGTDIVEDDGEVRHCTPRDRGHCCSSRELRSSFACSSATRPQTRTTLTLRTPLQTSRRGHPVLQTKEGTSYVSPCWKRAPSPNM